jgi:hypothetical protein
MLIMQVYHDSDQKTRLRSADMTPVVCPTPVETYDSSRISWLQTHFPISVDVMTPVVSPDSGRASRLQSSSMSYVLPPQLWKTSHDWARWLQHLTAWTLSQKQTGGTHDSFSVWNLSISRLRMFKCHVMCRVTNEHLARLDLRETCVSRKTQYPCNIGGSRSSNIWSCEPRLYAMWPWH